MLAASITIEIFINIISDLRDNVIHTKIVLDYRGSARTMYSPPPR